MSNAIGFSGGAAAPLHREFFIFEDVKLTPAGTARWPQLSGLTGLVTDERRHPCWRFIYVVKFRPEGKPLWVLAAPGDITNEPR